MVRQAVLSLDSMKILIFECQEFYESVNHDYPMELINQIAAYNLIFASHGILYNPNSFT